MGFELTKDLADGNSRIDSEAVKIREVLDDIELSETLIEETHDFVSQSFDDDVFDEDFSKESFWGVHFFVKNVTSLSFSNRREKFRIF